MGGEREEGELMRKIVIGLFWGAIAFYAGVSLVSIFRPLIAEEETYFLPALNVLRKGLPESISEMCVSHPPLYVYSLAAFMKLFGREVFVARLFGIFTLGISMALILGISRTQAKREGRRDSGIVGPLACLFYLICPLVFQGSFLLDIDNTVFNAAALLYTFVLLKLDDSLPLGIRKKLLLGILLCFVIWAKLTTSFALVFCLLVYFGSTRRFKDGLAVVAIGASIFVLSWIVFCHIFGFDARRLLFHIYQQTRWHSVLSERNYSGAFEILIRSVKITAWISLPFAALAIFALFESVKTAISGVKRERMFPALFGLVVFGGYLVTGGIYFGIPRYQYPAFAFFAVLIALSSFEDIGRLKFSFRSGVFLGGMAVFSVAYLAWAVRDPVYLINFKMKEAMIYQSRELKDIFIAFGAGVFGAPVLVTALFYGSLGISGNRLSFYPRLKVSLAAAFCVISLGMLLAQASAPYYVGYCYGEKETEAVVDYLKKSTTGRDLRMIVPNDIFYNVASEKVEYRLDRFWNNRAAMLSELGKPGPACFVYSIGHNTISQFKNSFLDREIQALLRANYRETRLGSYFIWEKD